MIIINDHIKGSISTYIYQVQTESKPIAIEPVQTRYIEEIIEMVNDKQLYYYIEDVKGYPEWKTIFIYKYLYLIDIIKNLPDVPQTPYDHWILGKACGYSEHAIEEFVEGRKFI